MNQSKAGKPARSTLDAMLDEASWLLSHAQALGDHGRYEEAAAEQARAAGCEEQVACLLDAVGQEVEAAIHRLSAASCYEKLGQDARAVTLLRAALAVELRDDFRVRVQQQMAACLARAKRTLARTVRGARKQSSRSVPTTR